MINFFLCLTILFVQNFSKYQTGTTSNISKQLHRNLQKPNSFSEYLFDLKHLYFVTKIKTHFKNYIHRLCNKYSITHVKNSWFS